MQTSDAGTFPKTFMPAFNKLRAEQGMNGFYKGLQPLWARQIPYTVVKFVAFEKFVQFFYTNVWTAPKESYSKATQLMITFLSGYCAGVFCAIISHPADTMVSIMNKRDSSAGAMTQCKEIYSEIGFGGLWKGLGTRIFMVGTLTCL